MAPVFKANFSAMLTLSEYILDNLKQGCFTVSLSGRPGHSVAIDEAHEMAINKDIKTSIVRPSPEYINRVVNYLPSRAKSLQNLDSQLFSEKEKSLVKAAL